MSCFADHFPAVDRDELLLSLQHGKEDAEQRLFVATDLTDCLSRVMDSGIAMRPHAWLCLSSLMPQGQQRVSELPFDRKTLFSHSTDKVQDYGPMRSISIISAPPTCTSQCGFYQANAFKVFHLTCPQSPTSHLSSRNRAVRPSPTLPQGWGLRSRHEAPETVVLPSPVWEGVCLCCSIYGPSLLTVCGCCGL